MPLQDLLFCFQTYCEMAEHTLHYIIILFSSVLSYLQGICLGHDKLHCKVSEPQKTNPVTNCLAKLLTT